MTNKLKDQILYIPIKSFNLVNQCKYYLSKIETLKVIKSNDQPDYSVITNL